MKVKSVVPVTVAVLISVLSGSVGAGQVQFGVKAGLSRAGQTWEYRLGTREHDHRFGFAFGNFADIPLTPILALRLDALYVQKGSQVLVRTVGYPGVPSQYLMFKDRIDYLSLSLTGKANLLSGPVGIYLMGGPRLDIKVGGEFELTHGLLSDSLYNSTVTGLVLGGGVEIAVSPCRLVLMEFRYDHDLTDAGEYPTGGGDLIIKSNSFQILAGLRF